MIHAYIWHILSPVTFNFSNTTTALAANSIKINVIIKNWPFKSITHRLHVVFDARSAGNTLCSFSQINDANSSVQSFVMSLGTSTLYLITHILIHELLIDETRYGQFMNHAIVDGRDRIITFKTNSDYTVTASVPHFWSTLGTFNASIFLFYTILILVLEIDPSYGVLLGYGDGECNNEHNTGGESLPSALVGGVIGGVLLLILLLLVTVFVIYPRYQIWKKARQRQNDMTEMTLTDFYNNGDELGDNDI